MAVLFRREDIHIDNTKKSINSKNHGKLPNSRVVKNRKSVMCYLKNTRVDRPNSFFFGGRYFKLPKVLIYVPYLVFLDPCLAIENNNKNISANLSSLTSYLQLDTLTSKTETSLTNYALMSRKAQNTFLQFSIRIFGADTFTRDFCSLSLDGNKRYTANYFFATGRIVVFFLQAHFKVSELRIQILVRLFKYFKFCVEFI